MIIQFKNIYKTILFFIFVLFHKVAYMDASHPWQTGFQDPATPIMEGIIFFNGLLMSFMILISCLVGWLLYKSLSLFNESVHRNPVGFTHSTLLEVVWTIIPAVILMIISIPSYNLLYAMDEVIDPSLTIKVVGHQWYWSYECSDFDVSPKDQEEGKELLDYGQKLLNMWVSIVKDVNLQVGASEDQTQITLAQELLNDLDNDLKEFPRELSLKESDILSNRLSLISMLLCKNEGFGGSNGDNEKLLENSITDILSSVKNKLKNFQIIDDQQKDLVIKILKFFKHYSKITENLQLDDVNSKIITSLFMVKLLNEIEEIPYDKIKNHLSTVYGLDDLRGSDSSKNLGSDDDSNEDDDDGLVIAELMEYDDDFKWCELASAESISDQDYYNLKRALGDFFTSERRCNNAALLEPEPEDENRPFLEVVNDLIQDLRKFKKARRIEELSESRLIDTQLIDHQLKLTRLKREFYSSESAYANAVSVLNLTKNEFNVVLDELNAAKLYSHLCSIDLAASNVNKLTAEYFQAEAASAVTDPKLLRSAWINKKGYYSWHKFLKLVAKKLSEADRMDFIHADEDLCKANCLLGKAQKDLTEEEVIRSNAIADNAKAKFMAMEREVISAMEEVKRGELIVEEAKSELKSYQEISNKAEVRLEKANNAFDKIKITLDRDKSVLKGAERVLKKAQLNLKSSDIDLSLDYNKMNDNLDIAQKNFILSKKDFNKAIVDVNNAKSDLFLCKERLKVSNKNLIETEEAFKNTGLLRTHEMRNGAYLEYYPNYLWEMRQEDLAFVKDQWGTDTSYYNSFAKSLSDSEKELSKKAGEFLESELKKTKILIENLTLTGSDNIALKEAVNHLSGIELDIVKVMHNNALNSFRNSQLILDITNKALHDANSKDISGYSGCVLSNDIEGINSNKLISDYADSCLDSFQAELKGAESDYEKATYILNEAKNLLTGASKILSKEYNNPFLDTLKSLHEKTSLSLFDRLEHLKKAIMEYSPLDTKLDQGLLQSKSYEEVLLAEAELANVKWLCARIAKTLNIPLSNDVKPFNVQFSYLKENSTAELVNASTNTSFTDNNIGSSDLEGGDDNFDDKKSSKPDSELEEILSRIIEKQFPSADGAKSKAPKSISEIKEIISKTTDEEFSNTSTGLEKKIIYSFADLFKSLNKKESSVLMGILNEAFYSITKDQLSQNQFIEEQIGLIKEELVEWKEKEIETERINFDSYLISDEDLVIPEALSTGKAGKVFRLLEVDNRLFVPTNTHIRLLVTSADVLHSWAVPSLGVKVDACPGRLNQVFLFVKREGVFYGQCSELCGVNHGFMPIVVQAVSQDEYLTWVGKRLCS